MPEHIGFSVEEHGAIQTVDFDFEAVDEALGFVRKARPTARQEAGELFRELANWCFGGKRSVRGALVKFVAICAGLRPELLDDRNGKDLAKEIGCTKQALSHQAVRFENAFQIKFARARSVEARRHMRERRLGGINHYLGKQKAKTQ
jgi:hypothetical protein